MVKKLVNAVMTLPAPAPPPAPTPSRSPPAAASLLRSDVSTLAAAEFGADGSGGGTLPLTAMMKAEVVESLLRREPEPARVAQAPPHRRQVALLRPHRHAGKGRHKGYGRKRHA